MLPRVWTWIKGRLRARPLDDLMAENKAAAERLDAAIKELLKQ